MSVFGAVLLRCAHNFRIKAVEAKQLNYLAPCVKVARLFLSWQSDCFRGPFDLQVLRRVKLPRMTFKQVLHNWGKLPTNSGAVTCGAEER